MVKRVALGWIVLCCACGSEPATQVVTAGGTTFVDALFVPTYWSGAPGEADGSGLEIVLADREGGCENIAARRTLAGAARARLSILHEGSASLAPGDYRAGALAPGSNGSAAAWYYRTDSSCRVVDRPRFSRSGTIVLSEVADDLVSGRMDVTLEDGTKLTGAFRAHRCAALALLPDDQAACVDH